MSALSVETPKIAFTYLRISSDRDGDELGVARQRTALAEHVGRHGWVYGKEFSDNDVSAYRGRKRPGYEALLEAIRGGECDVVCVTEMSRLTRHPRQLEDIVDLIEQTGVQVSATRAGTVDLSTSGGRVTARILGAVARQESEQMGERIRSKMAANAASGKPSGGPRPYGYERANGKLVVKPDEAERIKSWAAAILAGRSVSSIVADLNREGVPRMRGAGGWAGPTVRQILTSPRVIGYTSSGGEPVAPAEWPAILDRSDWERVRGVLDSSRRGPSPRKSLLAGLIRCGLCGTRMVGAARGPTKPRVYECMGSASGKGGCGKMSVSAHNVDDLIIGLVLGAASGANLALVRADRKIADAERLVRAIAEDEQLLNDLAADLGSRRLSRGEWISARGPLEERLHESRALLAALGTDRLPPDLVTLDQAKWDSLAFDQQRAVIALFIEKVTIMSVGVRSGSRFRPERCQVAWRA